MSTFFSFMRVLSNYIADAISELCFQELVGLRKSLIVEVNFWPFWRIYFFLEALEHLKNVIDRFERFRCWAVIKFYFKNVTTYSIYHFFLKSYWKNLPARSVYKFQKVSQKFSYFLTCFFCENWFRLILKQIVNKIPLLNCWAVFDSLTDFL